MAVSRPKNKSLQTVANALNRVGWFVPPPYVEVGTLEIMARSISEAQGQFTEDDVERVLGFIYTPDRVASGGF
jgi:hypothetical protein